MCRDAYQLRSLFDSVWGGLCVCNLLWSLQRRVKVTVRHKYMKIIENAFIVCSCWRYYRDTMQPDVTDTFPYTPPDIEVQYILNVTCVCTNNYGPRVHSIHYCLKHITLEINNTDLRSMYFPIKNYISTISRTTI